MAKKTIPAGEYAELLLGTAPACYNPACRRALMVVVGGLREKDFQVAHIRDELPPANREADIGWRYWPADDLSQAERNQHGNLILLCTPCHKIVDKREPREYTPELLREWKRAAEGTSFASVSTPSDVFDVEAVAAALAELLLAHPPLKLSLPELSAYETGGDGLSFASRSSVFAGSESELAALRAFVDSSDALSWWVVVGDAGAGKSRLALEACLELDESWARGFVDDGDQDQLVGFVPEQPTVLVVDYASARSEWLATILLDLVNRSTTRWPKVRVLLLERQASGSPWYAKATLQDRHHLSLRLMGARYGEPLEIRGFDRGQMRSLITSTMPEGTTAASVERLVDRAFELDDQGRPLFGLVSCLEASDPDLAAEGRDSVLRALIQRRVAQHGSASVGELASWIAATALGGISVDGDLARFSIPALAVDAGALSKLSQARMIQILAGLTPDVLGELWVLDELASADAKGMAAAAVSASWQLSPRRFASFVERTARDHPTHAALVSLLDVDPGVDLDEWYDVAAAIIPQIGNPESPTVLQVLGLVHQVGLSHDRIFTGHLPTQFQIGNLWLGKDNNKALACFLEVSSFSETNDELYWNCLTNSGIAHQLQEDSDAAKRCWTEVIEAIEPSDESRACCLNNRADIYDSEERREESIADRTSVLALEETTYNRRFIALVRRSRTLRALSRFVDAESDLDRILATDDIAPEQKNAARLQRAEWAWTDGDNDTARAEIVAVRSSPRNFDEVADAAADLWRRVADEEVPSS